jgi:hypothetical protein
MTLLIISGLQEVIKLIQESKVRFLEELGPNLQKIVKRLLANQNLLRLLYYTDKDPLNPDKPDVTIEQAYRNGDNGVVRIIPVVGYKEDSTSVLTLRVLRGTPSGDNTEFLDIYLAVEVFVPNEQWMIKSDNLRPYSIMGEIQKSLENKYINGLGTIRGSGFSVNFFTEEISAFLLNYKITQFN